MTAGIWRWEASLEKALFSLGGLVADEQEVGDFFEGGVLGEVGDLVAAIDERGLADSADGGLAGDHAFEAGGFELCGSGHGGSVGRGWDGTDPARSGGLDRAGHCSRLRRFDRGTGRTPGQAEVRAGERRGGAEGPLLAGV